MIPTILALCAVALLAATVVSLIGDDGGEPTITVAERRRHTPRHSSRVPLPLVAADWSPLPDWVRQVLAPTAHQAVTG